MNSVVVSILVLMAFIEYRVSVRYVETHNRVAIHDEYMGEIWDIFGDKVRAVMPLFETEVKGANMLNRLVNYPLYKNKLWRRQ
ncbi:MAG: hypothetical protein KBI10_06225 [Syntrophorhabdales bacterium]|nr:hypothetical protein [Syntrophorhabdales bacterium]